MGGLKMNKKKIKQAAKEFCEAEGVSFFQHVEANEGRTYYKQGVILEKFLQSMIEKGKVVTKDEADIYRSKIRVLTNVLEKNCLLEIKTVDGSDLESTVLGAGKEVNDEKTSKWILDEDCVRCNDIPLIEQSFPTKESRIAIKIASKAIEMKQLLEECIYIFVSNDYSDREFKNRIYNLLKEIQ